MVAEEGMQWAEPTLDCNEKFDEATQLAPEVRQRIATIPFNKCLERLETMVNSARECNRKWDLENNLIYYSRGAFIAEIMLKHKEFPSIKTKRPLEMKKFYALFSECVEMLEQRRHVLETMYENKKHVHALPSPIPTPVELPRKIQLRDLGDRTVISPRELVRRVEKAVPTPCALILDYRRNKEEKIAYKDESLVFTAEIPFDLVVGGLVYSHLVNGLSLHDGDRTNFTRLSKVHMVVLMGDAELQTDVAVILINALEQYNNMNRPRHPVILMDGGFRAWKDSYPSYVRGRSTAFSVTEPLDSIDDLIEQYRKMKLIPIVDTVTYPDLSPSKPPPSHPPPPMVHPTPPVLPPRPPPPDAGKAPPPGVPDPYPSMTEDVITPPPPIHPADPLVHPSLPDDFSKLLDSMTKPMSTTSSIHPYPSLSNQQPTVPFQAPPQEPFPPPQAPFPPPSLPVVDRGTKPSLNGGASQRTSSAFNPPTDITNGRYRTQETMARPPLPDRSAKPILISTEKGNKLLSIYSEIFTCLLAASRKGITKPGCTGLFNCGNTCFMNATLQALFHSPHMRDLFTKENFLNIVNVKNRMGTEGVISAAFSALMDLAWSGQINAIKPSRFIRLFASCVNDSMDDGRQHDAQEFQMFLLDALHEDTNMGLRENFQQNYKGGPNIVLDAQDFARKNHRFSHSPVQQIFNLQTVSELECRKCGERSATFEESSQLSLELPSAQFTTPLEKCISSHFSDTYLDGESRWNCPRCRCAQPAKRSTKLWTLPKVLVVHLKRFSMEGCGFTKNNMEVYFPRNGLTLSQVVHPDAPRHAEHTYSLYAITNHTGTLTSGHYTSLIEQEGTWFKCDDDLVRPWNSEFDPSGAFILFYRRL